MANAKIWFRPIGGPTITIDLGECLSDMFWEPERVAQDAVTVTGRTSRALDMGRLRVTVSLDRMVGREDLADKLETLQSHLERGGSCAVAADAGKAFAAFMVAPPRAGDTRIDWLFQPWAGIIGGAKSLVAGDRVAIQSPSPEAFRQFAKIDGFNLAGRYLTLPSGWPVAGNPQASPVLVRHKYFFPALLLPEDQLGTPAVTAEHGFNHSLSIQLAEDWGTIAADDFDAEANGLGYASSADFGSYLLDQDGARFVPDDGSNARHDPYS